MVPWMTATLPVEPTRTSPSGNVDIRILPGFPSGEITHARVDTRSVSTAAFLDHLTEFFYVVEGEGELWRRSGKEEEVVCLKPTRCVSIPPGVQYQFRCVQPPLVLLVIVAPQWRIEQWHVAPEPFWKEDGTEIRRRPLVGPISAWQRQDLPKQPDCPAPDGSEIRLLLECPAGGLCHCSLPSGMTSVAVRHKTVQEVWYVLRGNGEIWRAMDGEAEITALAKNTCVTLPVGTSFQFRSAGPEPLEILIGTFPRWPGAEEAVPVKGHW
jgi:mannose-6-phosphate isomerase-like protein (cupin superfamily)